MKRLLFIILIALSASFSADAQGGGRVQAVKMGYLSDRLKLSPEQADRFWPMYNRCSAERRSLRQAYGAGAAHNADDADEAMKQIDGNIEYQERELALRKRCKEEYLKVLSPQQVANLFDAERDFKKMLVDQLRERR
jgi:Spy/CpxP family protein refolding chaperone